MAVNPYFNNFPSQRRMANEHHLMEDVIVESIKMMGHNCYYIPRESLDTVDYIYGETTQVKFHHAFLIEMYLANVEGFEGDGDFFSKFGLEIRDNSNFILSRRSFAQRVPTTLRERPQEGDLIWVPVMHRMFEVKFIEKKLMFFSMGNRHPYVYEMRCEDFRYNNEPIHTGIEEIDDVQKDNAYAVEFDVTEIPNTVVRNYQIDEVVFQSPDITYANNYFRALVRDWDRPNSVIHVYEALGDYRENQTLRGNTSNAVWKVVSVANNKAENIMYDLSDNEYLAEDNTLILDLSELNPFGTP